MAFTKEQKKYFDYVITKEYLVEEYINKKHTANSIAIKIGCSKPKILKYLRIFNIPRRKCGFSTIVQCSMCSKEIKKCGSELKGNKTHFCSKDCLKKHRSLHNPMFNVASRKKSSLTHKMLPKRFNLKKVVYCCVDCANIIHWATAMYGDGRCKSCANKGERGSNFGKTVLIKQCKYKKQWFKSSWEANFAKWCDLSGIKCLYEPKAFVLEVNNKKCTYTPDFYLPEFDLWIEVKGRWMKDAEEKYTAFLQQYSNINIEIFNEDKLKEYSIYKYWELK